MHAELFEAMVTSFLVLGNMIEIVYISNANIELCLMYHLDFMQYLKTNLSVHYCVWLFVCNFTTNKEADLLQLIQELVKSKTVFAKVIDFGQD